MSDLPLSPIPECLHDEVREAWAAIAPAAAQRWPAPPAAWTAACDALPRVLAASRFVAQACARSPELLFALAESGDLARAYAADELRTRLLAEAGELRARGQADEAELKRWLRRCRRREMVRIAFRDLAGWAELPEVLADLSALADACLDAALAWLDDSLRARLGTPMGEQSGDPQRLVVLGLGKLGGGELNFSSDIDLIFAYPEDGETDKGSLSNHEFFTRLGRALIGVLNDATEDGFVFRVDLRLRPNGASGPLALSFDAMEHYYQAHGREWERYAFVKARAVAGDVGQGEELLARLKPFVYRKYLDYGAIEAIRGLKESINRELARRQVQDNIKVGPGGIREIEFVGQAFQLIRGGRERALQERSIRAVLPLLAKAGHLTPQAVEELLAAYRFLRDAENRLQMMADQQTHVLPQDDCERARLAFAMGYAGWPAFSHDLARHQRRVHAHFEQVFAAPQTERAQAQTPLVGVWLETLDDEAADAALVETGFPDVESAAAARNLLRGLHGGAAYQAFSKQGRERIDTLMPLLLAAAGLTASPLTTLERLVKVLEAIGRRSAYFALLIENPMALSQLVKLTAASAWIGDWLSRHPVLLDELLHPAVLYAPLSPEQLRSELRQRLAALPVEDLEAQMEAMREFHHGHVLRVAASEIGPGLPPERARAHLCDIAEAVLEEALALAGEALAAKHGGPACAGPGFTPGFAVIAYGKLGSCELGYASDLDITFLHEGCGPEGGATTGTRSLPNEVYFARLGQRLIHLLATRTAAGFLYQVDMRLRPSGQAGPLVTNLDAFRDYQQSKAWTWEHQALVRARAVAGTPRVREAFTAIRHEILTLQRDPEALRRDVLEMRDRMLAAQAPHDPGLFDLKQDRGGIVDIEFMVQYSVLRWAAEHPGLTRHTDNIGILEDLVAAGLLEQAQMQELAAAYRRYLSIEQRLKLMEARPLVPRAELDDVPERIMRIWDAAFAR